MYASALLLVMLSMLVPQASKPTPSAPVERTPQKGSATAQLAETPLVTFHDAELGFDYTYDRSLIPNADLAKQITESAQQMEGSTKKAGECLSTPLTAIDMTHGMRMVMVMRMNGECMGMHIDATAMGTMAQMSLQKGLQQLGSAKLSSPSNYQLAGHSASTMHGSTTSGKLGMTIYAQSSCVLMGNTAVCWMFLASDCSQLAPMGAYAIKFPDKPTEPVIPETLASSCSVQPEPPVH